MNPESPISWICTGWIPSSLADEYARWYKAQWPYTKQRFAKGVQRNINWAHFMAINFFNGFEARCLFSVVFLHMMRINAGYYEQTRFFKSPLPHQKKKENAHKSAKSLKARKVSHLFPSSWLWKLSFWAIWRSLRKLDDFTLRGERQHFNTLISMDNI